MLIECKYYKPHMTCLHCRISLKSVSVCPHCHRPMVHMGLDFKSPRRRDVRAWKREYLLYQAGYYYSRYGWDGPGYRGKTIDEIVAMREAAQQVKTVREAEEYLKQRQG